MFHIHVLFHFHLQKEFLHFFIFENVSSLLDFLCVCVTKNGQCCILAVQDFFCPIISCVTQHSQCCILAVRYFLCLHLFVSYFLLVFHVLLSDLVQLIFSSVFKLSRQNIVFVHFIYCTCFSRVS